MKNLSNRVNLIGNLGADPEVKEMANGKALAKMSLATSERYKNADGEKITDTQWHNLVIWGKQARVAGKYLKKGSRVAVEGKIMSRSYEKDGEKKYFTEIVVSDFMMLNSKPSGS